MLRDLATRRFFPLPRLYSKKCFADSGGIVSFTQLKFIVASLPAKKIAIRRIYSSACIPTASKFTRSFVSCRLFCAPVNFHNKRDRL